MGIGKSTDRGSSRPTAPSRASQHQRTHGNRADTAAANALTEGGSAAVNLTEHPSPLKLNESRGDCFVKMTLVKEKQANIIQFTFRGVERQSRLAKETIPFLLQALCRIDVTRGDDGTFTMKAKSPEDYQKVRGRDPDLVCRLINHLRNSGVSDQEIVRLMDGTAFSEFLSRGDLTFEGDETVNLRYTGHSDMTLAIVQQAVEDLCACGAYELACEVLDWKAVQTLDTEELWYGGEHPLRSTGAALSLTLIAAGKEIGNNFDEKFDKEFRPLKRLFCIARQGMTAESRLPQLDFESLVESSE